MCGRVRRKKAAAEGALLIYQSVPLRLQTSKCIHNSVIPAAAKIVVTNLDLVFLLRQKCLVCLSFFFCLGHSELPGGNIVS